MKRKIITAIFSLSFLFSAGCAAQNTGNTVGSKVEPSAQQTDGDSNLQAIRGEIQGAPDGEVIFTPAPGGEGVQVLVNVTGLKKPGFHAVHLHEHPVCDGNFESAGPHFNPENQPHGHPGKEKHHVGDLGNFRANSEGNIVETRVYDHLSLDPNSSNYVGNRSVVIHAQADDYTSQPSGGAGDRIGCVVLNPPEAEENQALAE